MPQMEINEILEQLEFYTIPFPHDAVEAAIERREEIAPHLVRILEETVQKAAERSDEASLYIGHIFAMFLLAEFRDPRAYEPLIALAKLPDGQTDRLLGDAQCQHLGPALAAVWHGNLGPIQSLIEDEAADEFSRMAGFTAIVVLVCLGELPREKAIAYFGELLDGRVGGSELLLTELVCCICDLHPEELYPKIQRAFEQGLVDETAIRFEEVEETRRLSIEKVLARTRDHPSNHLITDTAAQVEWWFGPSDTGELDDDLELYDDDDDDDDLELGPDNGVESHLDDPAFPWTEPALDWPPPQPFRREQPKIGRNDPCPCGSGKKYKKCCAK